MFYIKMLRHACVFTVLFYTTCSLLDRNGIENDGVVNYSSHNILRNTWKGFDEQVYTLNTDVFPGVHNDCLYFSVESIEFDLPDKGSFNSSWLMEQYDSHNFTVIGCNSSETIYSQYQCLNTVNNNLNNLFMFNATFKKQQRSNECSKDTWSMVQLSHTNLNDSNLFVYHTNKITAENNYYYHCGSLSFTSVSGDAKITLTNTTIQAFSLVGAKLSSKMVTCKKSYDYDYLNYIVSGGMGVSVILAIIVIIISCLTKRRKYGKYNLLDT